MSFKKFLCKSTMTAACLCSQHSLCLERIQSQSLDKGKVQKVYVAPGLASLLAFPCVIKEAVVGNSVLVSAKVSKRDPQAIILSLADSMKTATNLIVRCTNSKNPFVFDVVASRRFHQDFLKIDSVYGGPVRVNAGLRLLDSSSYSRVNDKKKVLREAKDEEPVEVEQPSVVMMHQKRLIKSYRVGGGD
jgi:hypothetical protein